MRITYRQLGIMIMMMSDEQKNCDVTLEMSDDECYGLDLTVTTENHDSLDANHPVLFPIKDDALRVSIPEAIDSFMSENPHTWGC